MLLQPWAAEQLVDSSGEAAIHYSRSCWGFYLAAAQNLAVTNIGWSVIPLLLSFLSVPSPLPSLYCLREMQHRVWPLTLSQFTMYRLQMALKRFVCTFSILICPVDKIWPICVNISSSFKLTQKFPSSQYCHQICLSQNSIFPGGSS